MNITKGRRYTQRSLTGFVFCFMPFSWDFMCVVRPFRIQFILPKNTHDFKDWRTNHFIVWINQVQIFIMRNIQAPFFSWYDSFTFFSLYFSISMMKNAFKNQVKTCRKHNSLFVYIAQENRIKSVEKFYCWRHFCTVINSLNHSGLGFSLSAGCTER